MYHVSSNKEVSGNKYHVFRTMQLVTCDIYDTCNLKLETLKLQKEF